MNKESKIIWTDLDGVLTDYASGFDQFIEKRHPEIPVQGSCARDLAYRTLYSWLGLEKTGDEKPLIKEFHDTQWYRQMPIFQDAIESIPRLQKAGYQFRALSHSREPEKTVPMKQANLDRGLSNVVVDVIPYEQKKSDFLSTMEPGIWVDDTLKNVQQGMGRHVCIWMPRYEVDEKTIRDARKEGILVVKNWTAISNRLLGVNHASQELLKTPSLNVTR